MKQTVTFLTALLLTMLAPLAVPAAELTLSSPLDFQVVQRRLRAQGCCGLSVN